MGIAWAGKAAMAPVNAISSEQVNGWFLFLTFACDLCC
jgi:hypothetical protein